MKLRIALKICRRYFDHSRDIRSRIGTRYRYGTVRKAIKIGRKRLLDQRFPYVPDDDELEQREELLLSVVAGLAKSMANDAGLPFPSELDAIAIDFSLFDDETPSTGANE